MQGELLAIVQEAVREDRAWTVDKVLAEARRIGPPTRRADAELDIRLPPRRDWRVTHTAG
jgi:hypothetical protein